MSSTSTTTPNGSLQDGLEEFPFTNSLSPVPKTKNSKKKKVVKHNFPTNNTKIISKIPVSPLGQNRDGCKEGEENKETSLDNDSPECIEVHTNGLLDKISDVKDKITEENSNSSLLNETETSMRLKLMSQEREDLLLEAENFRKSLEDIQGRHDSDFSDIKSKHADEILKIKSEHEKEISELQQKYTEEIAQIKVELDESIAVKDAAEAQYQNLLGRVSTIKSSLGERFKADRQELAEARTQIEELELARETQEQRQRELEKRIEISDSAYQEARREISCLTEQYNSSQQELSHHLDDLSTQLIQLRSEADASKEATASWEMLAMEERSRREGLTQRIKDADEQVLSYRQSLESAIRESDHYLETIENLRRSIDVAQDTQKRELQETTESYERQIEDLKKLIHEANSRISEYESSHNVQQAELDRLAPVEKELKEKNLLIGKLRHETIVLNEHLTKALRFLKKTKPEDNIDRQIVTNHFLHFLALDRSDPKKFQVLQLIASLLNWTDEQKEQAGLARPGASNFNYRLPSNNFHRTPSSSSLSIDLFNDGSTRKESLTELWKGFIGRTTEDGEMQNNTESQVMSSTTKPEKE
ncbi:GRIP domain-containing protein [Golovinomyces cichoracearum]|uniref:GRIP domain-containing protein n=1 Tax=Golovinomyces cichoracearum TaxID=62708 RepID=A0A420IY01_9PEZI|nr:GRIP domain-containing protein [Golovinomyces cichoracearum]